MPASLSSTNQRSSTKKILTCLSGVHVYPIKSTAGISLSIAAVEKQGLSFDRRFMIADLDGKMITARKFPQLLQVKSALKAGGLVVNFLDHAPLELNFDDFEMNEASCQVWQDTFQAWRTTKIADQWFSQVLGMPVQLLYTGEQSQRIRKKIETNVSFADGYPLLLIGQGSLDLLNQKSSNHNQMAQFRPNLVVAGSEPFEEDSWKRIRIGDVEFELVKPCIRCMLTTVNPQTSKANEQNEPLRTLLDFRADEDGLIYFGQNLIAKNEGVIHVGDEIEILERQTPPVYPGYHGQYQVLERDLTQQKKPIQLNIDGHEFSGNNQTSILEQAEQAGVAIANSCRAGLCGSCKVQLISGDVEQAKVPALDELEHANGKILACCCVPKSDVVIKR